MARMTVFLAIMLWIGLLSTMTFASPIGPATGTQRIQVVSQDFIDSQLAYEFDKVNDTLWHASFWADNASFATDVRFAFNKQCSHNAWLSLNNYYFAEYNMTTAELCSQLKNMTNYPTKVGNHTYIANFKWNQSNLSGSLDIVFPDGFVDGEMLKFGFNSTVATTITSTTSLSTTGRAICRTTNKIHVAWMNGTNVFYSNSSNGVTWGSPVTISTGAGDDPLEAPVIACSGTKVFIAWIDTDARGDINYFNSTNEGYEFNDGSHGPAIWRDGTGSSADGFHMGNVEYGVGSNIWVTYSWDGGTVESIIVDNASAYTGASPTATRVDLGVDCDVSANTLASLFVNVSGTTENVYVPYGCAKTSNMLVNYTNNSGTNWYGSAIVGPVTVSPTITLFNNTLYIGDSESSPSKRLFNSTNNGQTWNEIMSTTGFTSAVLSSSNSLTSSSSNLYWFFTSQSLSNVSLDIMNTTIGWTANTSFITTMSANATLPNAIKDNSVDSTKIDFVYFNKSAIIYDYISLGAPPDNPPTFASYNANTTTVGKPANISVVISDAVSLSGFIFGSNNTGVWSNSTWAALASGSLASNITTLNSTVNTKVGVSFYANDSINQWSIYNATITTTAADTCTYTSGDWFIKCSDNCDLSSAGQNIGGNNIIVYGNGTAGQIIFANVNASIFYMNATQCNVRFKKPFSFSLKR